MRQIKVVHKVYIMLSGFQHIIMRSVPWWLWQQCSYTNYMSTSTWRAILHLSASRWYHQPYSLCKSNWKCNVCHFIVMLLHYSAIIVRIFSGSHCRMGVVLLTTTTLVKHFISITVGMHM